MEDSDLTCLEDGAALATDADHQLVLPPKARALSSTEEEEEEEQEYIENLISKEGSFDGTSHPSSSWTSSSMAAEDWFKSARSSAIQWILKTQVYFGFGNQTAYLAVAYFDRFCLRRTIDGERWPWAVPLLSIACLSLAAKMEERRAPPPSEFWVEGYAYASDVIQRMELLVLSTLEWRMNIVTPFDYLNHFTSKFRHDDRSGDDDNLTRKATRFIIDAIEVITALDYRPSTVAAAAILAAECSGRLTEELVESKLTALSSSYAFLHKEHVYSCYNAMSHESRTKLKAPKRGVGDASSGAIDPPPPFSAMTHKRIRLQMPASTH